jgi:hypothetical protein
MIGSNGSYCYDQSVIRHIDVPSKVRSSTIVYIMIIRIVSINYLHFKQSIFTTSTGRQRRTHDDIDCSTLDIMTFDSSKQLSERLDQRSWLDCTDSCTGK